MADYSNFENPYGSDMIRESSILNEMGDLPSVAPEQGTPESEGDRVLDSEIRSRIYVPVRTGFLLDGRRGTAEFAGISVGNKGVVSSQTGDNAVSGDFYRLFVNTFPDASNVTVWASGGTSPDGTLTGTIGDLCVVAGGSLWVNTDGATAWSEYRSVLQSKQAEFVCYDFTEDVPTGDGAFYIRIHPELAGWRVSNPWTRCITAGTTGSMAVQVYSVTQTHDLTTAAIETASGDVESAEATVDPTYEEMASGELLRIDVDAVSTTPQKGLIVGFTLLPPA